MDSVGLKRFRMTLDSIEKMLTERIARKRGAAALARLTGRVRHMHHPAGHEAAVRRLGNEAALLLRVQAAARRIDSGRFGICLACQNPISERHLHAVPWAAFCVPCRKAVDSGEAHLSWRPARPATGA
jgi:RNA polymerase-binding transcription factor DksA